MSVSDELANSLVKLNLGWTGHLQYMSEYMQYETMGPGNTAAHPTLVGYKPSAPPLFL